MTSTPDPGLITAQKDLPKSADTIRGRVFIGVAIAAIIGVATYVWGTIDQRRKDELAFRNNQIEKLYGPLYATIEANTAVWKPFNEHVNHSNHAQPGSITPGQSAIWRSWMTTVFQPQNVAMEKVILENAQLIEGNGMPNAFSQLIEHTEAYKGVMVSWTEAQSPDVPLTTWIKFPDNLEDCIVKSYGILRERQFALQHQVVPHWRPVLALPETCQHKDEPAQTYAQVLASERGR